MKLKNSISSNSLKIIDLYNKIEAGLLDTSPNFQRKLVWKKQHKYAFIQTILLNYPFPEIYIASAEVDVEKLQAVEIVVDGQQRLNAIVDYIKGRNDFEKQKKVPSFDELSTDEKKEFLNYSVTVKDLKDLNMDLIKEIFKRINSTDYSLNANEILNAQYGDGEFAYFAKQLVDDRFEVSDDVTDVIIDKKLREYVVNFFRENEVFTDNEIKRMFDTQYIMLIVSTLLEGRYFGRNTKINYYLEKYNLEFNNYQELLSKILNSIEIIDQLKMSSGSYWFNKPNLFTLIIELNSINKEDIDLNLLDLQLSELENKVDLYFKGDEEDIKLLTNEESRFFELSRQGSHELASREFRGKVIHKFIEQSMITSEISKEKEESSSFLEKNLEKLNEKEIDYAILIPTNTGLSKNIMDATLSVRTFLEKNDIHHYNTQEYGPNHKVIRQALLLLNDSPIDSEASLYRSNGRGDYRIWFKDLKSLADSNNELALLYKNEKIIVLNLSKYDYTEYINNFMS